MRAQTRHQLKQDKFNRVTLNAAEATVHWSVAHKNNLLIGLGILVVVVAAAIGGWYFNTQQNDQASLALQQGVRTLEIPIRPAGTPPQPEFFTYGSATERESTAHKQFQAVIDKYPHTRCADFARYFLGVTSVGMGDNASSERQFKDAASLHNKEVASLAEFALASLYANTNRTSEAVDLYKKLIDKPTSTVAKATAEIALADTYAAAGQGNEAKRLLQQIQKENPASETAQLAGQKLQNLR